MRSDICGLFWDDTPPPKPPKKEKIKRIAPDRFWEKIDYLPNLEDAKNQDWNLYTDDELILASKKEPLIFDIESYINYFIIGFMGAVSRKVIFFEKDENNLFSNLQVSKLKWVMENFCVIGFNSRNYDMPIAALAVNNFMCNELKHAGDLIIQEGMWASHVLKRFKTSALISNHIDLIEVAPLQASLKLYAGRLHSKRMQDLPVSPESILTAEQKLIVKWYNINDLTNTLDLYLSLVKEIKLREDLGKEYHQDLRSKSDAQIAEAVISRELEKINKKRISKPVIAPGTCYKYKTPAFIKYSTPLLQSMLKEIQNANYMVGESGKPVMPINLQDFVVKINQTSYKIGMGGLHSQEKKISHYSDDQYILIDRDVTSYYPFIILNLGLFPAHLSRAFLTVYEKIVSKRLAAKKAGNKTVANSLKIVINGSFGKLGNKYSALYSPDLLLQVTLTGQLSLLMLIERIELAGIEVVSANTDGIVIKCPRSRESELNIIVKQWEKDTKFNTEETRYASLHSRDVNNYIAVYEDKSDCKTKGAFSLAGLFKNPTCEICIDAVREYLLRGIDLKETITSSSELSKFIAVRRVKGGAVEATRIDPEAEVEDRFKKELAIKSGWVEIAAAQWVRQKWIDDKLEYGRLAVNLQQAYRESSLVKYGAYLGKAIRWYYSSDKDPELDELVYAGSGNKVPRSEGAKPAMLFPESFPKDINYDWYIEEARSILEQVKALP